MPDPDIDPLRGTPDTFGVPLPILGNMSPLLQSMGASDKFAAAFTVAIVAVNAAWEALKADVAAFRVQPEPSEGE